MRPSLTVMFSQSKVGSGPISITSTYFSENRSMASTKPVPFSTPSNERISLENTPTPDMGAERSATPRARLARPLGFEHAFRFWAHIGALALSRQWEEECQPPSRTMSEISRELVVRPARLPFRNLIQCVAQDSLHPTNTVTGSSSPPRSLLTICSIHYSILSLLVPAIPNRGPHTTHSYDSASA